MLCTNGRAVFHSADALSVLYLSVGPRTLGWPWLLGTLCMAQLWVPVQKRLNLLITFMSIDMGAELLSYKIISFNFPPCSLSCLSQHCSPI